MATAAPPRRTGPPIDPRIRERRAAVARQAGRRRLRVLLAALGVLSVLALAATAAASPLLDVDRVRVVGSARTAPDEVAARAGLAPGMPMATLRPSAAATRLETLPWVDSATVRRRWPSTVVVEVVERVPAAALARARGRWALVDIEGRVLEVVVGPPVGLVHVHNAHPETGVGRTVGERALVAVRAAAGLPLALRDAVGGINLTPGGVELALKAGGVVRLGDGRDLEAKLVAARTVLARVGPRAVSVLDVRAPRAPVLVRR